MAAVAVTLIVLLPPQLVIVRVALLLMVKVAEFVPCPPVRTAPGVALHIYPPGGIVPATVAVIDPPLQILAPGESVIAGGAGTFDIESVFVPVQPFTVCDASKIQGPAPVNITEADELLAP